MKKLSLLFCGCVISFLMGCNQQETKSSQDQITFAMSGVYPPFNYRKQGVLKGFDVEIGKAIITKMGKEPKAVTNPWATIIQGLKSDKYDLIVGSMANTPKRSEQVSFSRPYYRSGAQIFVKQDNQKITGQDSLKGKRVGVIKASTFERAAKKVTDDDNIKSYSSDILALQDLVAGRVDAVITDRLTGLDAKVNAKIKIKEVGAPLYVDEMAIAVKKGNQELLDAVNKALNAIIADGTYEKISKKWFGENILKP